MISSMLASAISQAYPEAVIYKEQASQIERPAFYITEIKVSQTRAIGNRYYRYHQMVVRYFPLEEGAADHEALNAVADKLYAALEYLAYDGWRGRGLQMNHRIEDNVLQFFVTVQLALKRPTNDPKMEQLQTETTLKE